MRVFALLLCTGLAAGALVKREAEAKAEAEADYVSHGGETVAVYEGVMRKPLAET